MGLLDHIIWGIICSGLVIFLAWRIKGYVDEVKKNQSFKRKNNYE